MYFQFYVLKIKETHQRNCNYSYADNGIAVGNGTVFPLIMILGVKMQQILIEHFVSGMPINHYTVYVARYTTIVSSISYPWCIIIAMKPG